VDPGAVRLLVFQAHYRQKMDLTDESLAMARESARRLGEFDGRLRAARRDGRVRLVEGMGHLARTAGY
jgi:cysteinyl-tRNA synthetase